MMINNPRCLAIQKKADDLRQQLGLTEYPIKAGEIIKTHFHDKILLAYYPMRGDSDAFTYYHQDLDMYLIIINKDRTTKKWLKRLNFSLAHELGHIILDHKRFYIHKNSQPFQEEEADEFAGQFLMPFDEMRYAMHFLPHGISDYFYVSHLAAAKRIQRVNEDYKELYGRCKYDQY